MPKLKYQRLLLKLSGEALAGPKGFGISNEILKETALEIKAIQALGAEIGIVTGGGNFMRGLTASEQGFERVSADQMGMLATVINSMALQNALENEGLPTTVMSAIPINGVVEPYSRRNAVRLFSEKQILLFAAGTGNPFFTTDSAATLRAIETNCDIIMKATKVDGIYDKDPVKHSDATKYDFLNYSQVIQQDLRVMDTASIALCKENTLPILVFNMTQPGNLFKAATGESLGTMVDTKE